MGNTCRVAPFPFLGEESAVKKKAFHNPFQGLRLEDLRRDEPPAPEAAPAENGPPVDEDARLFLESVGDVVPLRSGPERVPPPRPNHAPSTREDDEAEVFAELCELVDGTAPFDLADSDEFIEGSIPSLDKRILRKLRKGEYAIEGHIDLHGLLREEAKAALTDFLESSRRAGKRCVLVVHGRGLHSKDRIPVLKEGVQVWLTRGRLARQVLAFATARPHDGGAGAVYVLLRRDRRDEF